MPITISFGKKTNIEQLSHTPITIDLDNPLTKKQLSDSTHVCMLNGKPYFLNPKTRPDTTISISIDNNIDWILDLSTAIVNKVTEEMVFDPMKTIRSFIEASEKSTNLQFAKPNPPISLTELHFIYNDKYMNLERDNNLIIAIKYGLMSNSLIDINNYDIKHELYGWKYSKNPSPDKPPYYKEKRELSEYRLTNCWKEDGTRTVGDTKIIQASHTVTAYYGIDYNFIIKGKVIRKRVEIDQSGKLSYINEKTDDARFEKVPSTILEPFTYKVKRDALPGEFDFVVCRVIRDGENISFESNVDHKLVEGVKLTNFTFQLQQSGTLETLFTNPATRGQVVKTGPKMTNKLFEKGLYVTVTGDRTFSLAKDPENREPVKYQDLKSAYYMRYKLDMNSPGDSAITNMISESYGGINPILPPINPVAQNTNKLYSDLLDKLTSQIEGEIQHAVNHFLDYGPAMEYHEADQNRDPNKRQGDPSFKLTGKKETQYHIKEDLSPKDNYRTADRGKSYSYNYLTKDGYKALLPVDLPYDKELSKRNVFVENPSNLPKNCTDTKIFTIHSINEDDGDDKAIVVNCSQIYLYSLDFDNGIKIIVNNPNSLGYDFDDNDTWEYEDI